MFRITLNSSAHSEWFKDFDGMRIDIRDEEAYFQPVSLKDEPEAVEVRVRGERGGLEAVIEGSREEELRRCLTNPHGNPYFILRATNGWLRAEPYAASGEPPRAEWTMRMWGDETKNQKLAKVSQTVADLSATRFFSEAMEAYRLVSDYDRKKIQGRPPAEVTQARNLLDLYMQLAWRIAPLYKAELYRALGQAMGVADDEAGEEVEDAGEVPVLRPARRGRPPGQTQKAAAVVEAAQPEVQVAKTLPSPSESPAPGHPARVKDARVDREMPDEAAEMLGLTAPAAMAGNVPTRVPPPRTSAPPAAVQAQALRFTRQGRGPRRWRSS